MLRRTSIGLVTIIFLVACMPQNIPDRSTLTQTLSGANKGYPPPLPPSPTVDTGYPIPTPAPTLSATEAKSIEQTQVAEATEFTLTRFAPTATPLPTSTSLPDGTTCFVNRTAHFTLKLLPGWHTDAIWDKPFNTAIYNYDQERLCSECSLLPDGLKVDISVVPLAEKSFEQWVNDERVRENPGDPPIKLTEPYSYTIGTYHGVVYTATGYGDDVLLVKLHGDGKVISIGLVPEKSTALDEALSMLSTLDISGKDTCK